MRIIWNGLPNIAIRWYPLVVLAAIAAVAYWISTPTRFSLAPLQDGRTLVMQLYSKEVSRELLLANYAKPMAELIGEDSTVERLYYWVKPNYLQIDVTLRDNSSENFFRLKDLIDEQITSRSGGKLQASVKWRDPQAADLLVAIMREDNSSELLYQTGLRLIKQIAETLETGKHFILGNNSADAASDFWNNPIYFNGQPATLVAIYAPTNTASHDFDWRLRTEALAAERSSENLWKLRFMPQRALLERNWINVIAYGGFIALTAAMLLSWIFMGLQNFLSLSLKSLLLLSVSIMLYHIFVGPVHYSALFGLLLAYPVALLGMLRFRQESRSIAEGQSQNNVAEQSAKHGTTLICISFALPLIIAAFPATPLTLRSYIGMPAIMAMIGLIAAALAELTLAPAVRVLSRFRDAKADNRRAGANFKNRLATSQIIMAAVGLALSIFFSQKLSGLWQAPSDGQQPPRQYYMAIEGAKEELAEATGKISQALADNSSLVPRHVAYVGHGGVNAEQGLTPAMPDPTRSVFSLTLRPQANMSQIFSIVRSTIAQFKLPVTASQLTENYLPGTLDKPDGSIEKNLPTHQYFLWPASIILGAAFASLALVRLRGHDYKHALARSCWVTAVASASTFIFLHWFKLERIGPHELIGLALAIGAGIASEGMQARKRLIWLSSCWLFLAVTVYFTNEWLACAIVGGCITLTSLANMLFDIYYRRLSVRSGQTR